MEIIARIVLGSIGLFLLLISIYGLVNRKEIIRATKQAQRDLNENDNGLFIVSGVTRSNPDEGGLKNGKKLSKFYLDTIK